MSHQVHGLLGQGIRGSTRALFAGEVGREIRIATDPDFAIQRIILQKAVCAEAHSENLIGNAVGFNDPQIALIMGQ
jgi:hypothetical protein